MNFSKDTAGYFGHGKFSEDEEVAINSALQKKLGPNYIPQV